MGAVRAWRRKIGNLKCPVSHLRCDSVHSSLPRSSSFERNHRIGSLGHV
jgi:hypothetical protein